MTPTSITFNGFSLQTANIVTSRIDHYQQPVRILDILTYANGDGSGITGDKRTQKVIVVEGTIGRYATRELTESAIDAMKLALKGREKELDINVAGTTRRYIATAQFDGSSDVEYLGPTLSKFSIEFICIDPFGHDTTFSNPVNSFRNLLAGTSSFETDITGWTAYNGATLAQELNRQYYSTASLRITTTGTGVNALQGANSPAVTVITGQTYTASFWVQGTAGHVVRCYVGSGGTDTFTSLTLTGNWQRVSNTHTATTTSLTVIVMVEGANTLARVVYIDGVQIEAGSTATDYSEQKVTSARVNYPFTVGGNYKAEPVINLKLATVTGGVGKTLTVTNRKTLESISATRTWGTAWSLDISTGAMSITSSSNDYEVTNEVTTSIWVNLDSNIGTLINKRFPSASFRSFITEFASSLVKFSVYTTTGTAAAATDTVVRPTGTWINYVSVYDGTAVKLYVNGLLVASTPLTGQIQTDNGQPLRIGAFDGTAAPLDGRIKTPRVWNRALSAEEIHYLYNANRAPRNGLVLEYLMNEGTGSTLANTSGKGAAGTFSGATWTAAHSEIVIDSVHKEFTVDGTEVDYSGTFPVLEPGEATLDISDTFTTRSYGANITYDKRWL